MPIRLIKDEERLVYEAEGTKIFYRRISDVKKAANVKRYTKKGKTDWGAVTSDLLRQIVLGWENMKDGDMDVPFDPELVTRLPGDVVEDLLNLSGAGNPSGEEESAAKNSVSSLPSKSSTGTVDTACIASRFISSVVL